MTGNTPTTDAATDALFREWEETEQATNLDDIRPIDAIVFGFFWALFAVVFLQFFTRYVLNNALGWTEEIARYLLIGVCFTGSVMAVRKGTHITV
ncbi:MAG: TRAP transporter small permease, partial [Beijerinckiaceae bacterium]